MLEEAVGDAAALMVDSGEKEEARGSKQTIETALVLRGDDEREYLRGDKLWH